MAEKRHKHRHVGLWVLGVLVLLIVGVRIAAAPLARHYTQKALDAIPGYKGSFSDVKLSFIHLSYTITHLKLLEDEEAKKKTGIPYIYAESAQAHVAWSDLLHFKLGAAVRVDDAKLTVTLPMPKAKPLPDPATILYSLFPFRVDRVALHHDQAVVIDGSQTDVPEKDRELWVHDIEATVENVATRRDLARGEPTILALKAKVQRSGDLRVFVTADPLTHGLTFAGETSLRGLKLDELWGFLVEKADMQPVSGTVDAFVAFKCVKGELDGTIKPELRNVKLTAASKGLGPKLKAWLADTALKITSDRVPGRNATIAVIPLKGTIKGPHVELWPTILSVLRNSYVAAIEGGFAHVPEETSPQKQGLVRQAAQAFNPRKFPKAQPQKGKAQPQNGGRQP